jgi:hypothetical protein
MIRAAKRLVYYQKPLVYTIVAATGQNKKNYRTCNVRSTVEYHAEGPSKYETGG